MAARQAARRRIVSTRKIRRTCQPTQVKFSIQPFPKRLVGSLGAKPLSRPPQRAKPLMIQKDQEGQPQRPGGTLGRRGTLSRGSPQDAVLPLPPAKRNPRQREETQKRFDSLTRFCAPDKSEVRHAAISPKLRPRFPQAACGPPLPIFGLRPRRNGVGFRFLRKARRALPSTCQPFEKGWTQNFLCQRF